MKKILLLAIVLLYLPKIGLAADCKTVKRTGTATGDDATYKYVGETDNGNTLNCFIDGSNCCQWNNGDGPGDLVVFVGGTAINGTTAESIVRTKIRQGILSGQVNGDNQVGYYSWQATDVANYTYSFDDGH